MAVLQIAASTRNDDNLDKDCFDGDHRLLI
jgi:hypothetical protein